MTLVSRAACGIMLKAFWFGTRARAAFKVAGLLTLSGVLLMTGCTNHARTPAPSTGTESRSFPVYEPFAIDEAGSQVTVTFELPDARDNGILRPVFIGFRTIQASSDGTDESVARMSALSDFLYTSPLPVRIRLTRIDGGAEVPVVLSDRHRDMVAQRTWWRPHPEDVFMNHGPASTDDNPTIDSGRFDFEAAYRIRHFARIIPPKPGRYRLDITNLESQPSLVELKRAVPTLRYELLVSHYHQRGIE